MRRIAASSFTVPIGEGEVKQGAPHPAIDDPCGHAGGALLPTGATPAAARESRALPPSAAQDRLRLGGTSMLPISRPATSEASTITSENAVSSPR